MKCFRKAAAAASMLSCVDMMLLVIQCVSVCEEVARYSVLCNFVIGMEKQKMIAIECVSKLCQVLVAFHP